MNKALCSWHTRGGIQCPSQGVTWVTLYGKSRLVCMDHESCGEDSERGDQIVKEKLEQQSINAALAKGGNPALQMERAIANRRQRDKATALEIYRAKRKELEAKGETKQQAHEEALAELYRTAKYKAGDPLRSGVSSIASNSNQGRANGSGRAA